MNEEKQEVKTWVEDKLKCLNPSHSFPSHLYIEPGQTYKHVCPGCKSEISVTSPMIYW